MLLIDDEAAVRQDLAVAFRGEGYCVRVEPDGSALREVAEEFQPDVAVVDLRLPVGPDGLAMARMLRQADDVPVLILSSVDSLEGRLAAFDAGAEDHVAKPFSTAEVVARTQALLRRAGRLASGPLRVADIVIDDSTHTVSRSGEPVNLTSIEYDLLLLLARRANRILSKPHLLAKLGDVDAYDPNIIEVHVSALRRKLEAHGPRVIDTVRGVGYVLRS